jgi:tripartite-type tricarboxylate transporter receptor subunit TctC
MCRMKCWSFACVISIASVLALLATPSFAQSWPQRPVRMIVPIVAGSSPDVAARVFAEHLAARWGRPVVIENRPGADGLIGTAAFATAQDDHVLLFSFAAPLTVYPVIQEKLPYDAARDVVPISAVTETFGTISVPASLSVTTLSELVALARSRPGELNWTTGGGAFPILFAGFVKSAGLDMVQVSYRDQNLAIQDLTEGRIGAFGPRGIPEDRRERISADIREIATDNTVAQRLAGTGQIVGGSPPAEFSAAIQEQRAEIEAIVRLIGKPTQ